MIILIASTSVPESDKKTQSMLENDLSVHGSDKNSLRGNNNSILLLKFNF